MRGHDLHPRACALCAPMMVAVGTTHAHASRQSSFFYKPLSNVGRVARGHAGSEQASGIIIDGLGQEGAICGRSGGARAQGSHAEGIGMSDRETFIARCPRRKRASAQDSESAEPSAPADDPAGQAPQAVEAPQAVGYALAAAAADAPASDAPAPPEDASSVPQVPSIESIVAESDVRAFLAPGVPPELTRAALRRAWSADPKIRDFIGLSENSWDFNDPG